MPAGLINVYLLATQVRRKGRSHFTDSERAIVEFGRYRCFLLGLPEELLPATPDEILARAQVPTVNGRPIRKDEIELHARGLYIESWLPERRSRRKPLLFVHGELAGSWAWAQFLGYFAARGWEGHALNLRNHYWSQTAEPEELSFETYVDDVGAALDRFGPGVVVVGHGLGALLALKAAERQAIAGLVLIAPEAPLDVRGRAEAHEIRDDVRRARRWLALRDALVRR